MHLLEIKNLTKSFNDKVVLQNINLTINKGKIIGLLGKNGAGKTTLIKIINDLLTPLNGEVLIDGFKVGETVTITYYDRSSNEVKTVDVILKK